MQNSRTHQLKNWLATVFSAQHSQLVPLAGDAGFRRYFRFSYQNESYIAVDAPVDYSNNHAFVAVQQFLQQANVLVPQIYASDLTQGFLCLTDLGEVLLADTLTHDNVSDYYQQALIELRKVVAYTQQQSLTLPEFDETFIRTELAIFQQWLLQHHLSITLNANEQKALNDCFDYLVAAILQQPKVFMHRDYHSRNLMLVEQQLAMIDFQDAVLGPVTYDLISLLRDCYVRWPQQLIQPLMLDYLAQIKPLLTDVNISEQTWLRWCDLTGLQRHLKASGIFARLYHRDNKPGYLKDIPLTLSYIQDISKSYDKLAFLQQLISERVLPALLAKSDLVQQK